MNPYSSVLHPILHLGLNTPRVLLHVRVLLHGSVRDLHTMVPPTRLDGNLTTNRITSLIWNKLHTHRRIWRVRRQGSGYSSVHPLRRRLYPPVDAQPPPRKCGDHLRPRLWGWVRWTERGGGRVRRQRWLPESRPARRIGQG